MNKLIVIGWTGVRRCYLNVSKEEAIRRFNESEGGESATEQIYEEFEFDDEFGAYDVWK